MKSLYKEYKECFEGIVKARNTLTKLSKVNSPVMAKNDKDDTKDKPAKKVDNAVDEEFWFEAKPNSKQVSKPKAIYKKEKN